MSFALWPLFSIYLLVRLQQQATHKWLLVIHTTSKRTDYLKYEHFLNGSYVSAIIFLVGWLLLGNHMQFRQPLDIQLQVKPASIWNVVHEFAHVLKGLGLKYWLYHYLFIRKIWLTNEEQFVQNMPHIFCALTIMMMTPSTKTTTTTIIATF